MNSRKIKRCFLLLAIGSTTIISTAAFQQSPSSSIPFYNHDGNRDCTKKNKSKPTPSTVNISNNRDTQKYNVNIDGKVYPIATARPDTNQAGSILTTSPAVLLHSGPGSGKSRVLSARISHLLASSSDAGHHNAYSIRSGGVRPEGIIVLSFAKRDAVMIRHRAVQMYTESLASSGSASADQGSSDFEERIWAGTFHGFAAALLRKYGDRRSFSICSAVEQNRRVNAILQQNVDIAPELMESAKVECGSELVSSILQAFQFWKEAGILTPILYDQQQQKPWSLFRVDAKEAIEMAHAQLCIPKSASEIAVQIYPSYQTAQNEYNKVAAADLIPLALSLLKNNEKLLDKVRSQVEHIIVDEYQDSSVAQLELLKLIVRGRDANNGSFYSTATNFDVPKLFCAGDTNQSIYAWRGAQPTQTVENFIRDYPQGLVIPLETSYRLPAHILATANTLIGVDAAPSKLHVPMKSFARSPAAINSLKKSNISPKFWKDDLVPEWEQRVMIKELWDPRAEAQWIATEIRKRFKLRKSESLQDDDTFYDTTEIAVMVRTASQMRDLEEALCERKVPFSTDGSPSFSKRGNFRNAPRIDVKAKHNRSQLSKLSSRRASDANNASMVCRNGVELFYSRKEVQTALTCLQVVLECSACNDTAFNELLLIARQADNVAIKSMKAQVRIGTFKSLYDAAVARNSLRGVISFVSAWNVVFHNAQWLSWSTEERRFTLRLFLSKIGFLSGVTEARAITSKVLNDIKNLEGINFDDLLCQMFHPRKSRAGSSSGEDLAKKRQNESLEDFCSFASERRDLNQFIIDSSMGEEESIYPNSRDRKDAKFASGQHQPNDINMVPVRILTMHRAKGDEFDDVYLCGWEEGIFPQATAKSDGAMEEERRLAYVALTRARQRAVITYAMRRRKQSGIGVKHNRPSRFLMELLNRQGLGKDSHIAMAAGTSVQGMKPVMSGFHGTEHFEREHALRKAQLSKKRKHARCNRSSALSRQAKRYGDLLTSPPVEYNLKNCVEQGMKGLHEGRNDDPSPLLCEDDELCCADLDIVKRDLVSLYDKSNQRNGTKPKLKVKFKKMLKNLFDMQQGRALVIDNSAYVNDSSRNSMIADTPSNQIKTKPLSRCTAKELGLYLMHLILKRNERMDYRNL